MSKGVDMQRRKKAGEFESKEERKSQIKEIKLLCHYIISLRCSSSLPLLCNQSRVWLPAIIKRQILEVGEKGKRFLLIGSMIWEDRGLPIFRFIRLISSTKHRQNPAGPSKTKIRGSTQNSCSIFKVLFFGA